MRIRLYLCCVTLLVVGRATFAAAQVTTKAPEFNILPPDPGCFETDMWKWQTNPRSDADGIHGHTYPDWTGTYWSAVLSAPLETVMTIRGQFPKARYMSFQVYDADGAPLGGITDVQINPDAGQNNPFRSGTEQGTYTVRLRFGRQPGNAPPNNTFYTAGASTVMMIYRVYYPDNPEDLAAAVDPPLPVLSMDNKGITFFSCPPRPVLRPENATINGRLDDIDFVGAVSGQLLPATNSPIWGFQFSNPAVGFPSRDNDYMYTFVSRAYLKYPYNYNMVVIHMRAPTFPDTQGGVPPYTSSDVRFWSICQNEPMTGTVVRCVADNMAAKLNGWVTLVISDPSLRPADSVLNAWGATWLPWGALQPFDFVYDPNLNVLTNANGVFYNGFLLYRQTLANPSFTQSIHVISRLGAFQRRSAMGDYWPTIGYCSSANFEQFGSGCIGRGNDRVPQSQ